MKKQILCGALALLTMTACSDSFLDVNPTTNMTENEYYNSEERMYKALVASYDPLQWPDWAFGQYNPLSILSDVMSEDLYPGGATAQDNEHWHRMNNFTATPEYVCAGVWTVFYSGINRANIVITKMPGVTNISDESRNRFLAEAHTLRAYYYTWLWKLWGNVPYYDVNPSSSPYLVDQMKADDIYPRILADLEFATEGTRLPESVDAAEKGRITKGMAQMLKAEVVMYQNDTENFPKVLADMRAMINSGVYDLEKNFAGIWDDKGEWCKESIWEINYSDLNSQRSWNSPIATGGSVTPTLVGINNLSNSPEFAGGWGFGAVRPEIYNLYPEADQRKDGGILNFEKYAAKYPAINIAYEPRFENTGFFLLKYLPRKGENEECTGDKDLNYRNNYRVYRFAETLLNATELILRTGGSQAEAQGYLDQVRARAFRVTVAELGTNKVTATLESVLHERHLELTCEGKRFWDLVRSGKAESVLGKQGYAANKKYLPLPSAEIDKAQGSLTQNPY